MNKLGQLRVCSAAIVDLGKREREKHDWGVETHSFKVLLVWYKSMQKVPWASPGKKVAALEKNLGKRLLVSITD